MTPNWIEQDWLKRWSLYAPNFSPLKDLSSGREFTYKLLYDWSRSLGLELIKKFGIEPGDRIATLGKNHWAFVPLFFACQRVGAALVPINFRLTPREIEHILGDCTPKALFYGEEYTGVAKELSHLVPETQQWLFSGADGLSTWLMQQNENAPPLDMVGDENSLAMILYTSGTTGKPKGAMISRAMQFWNSMNTTLRLDLRQSDSHVAFMPFFHTGGWNVLLTPSLHSGARTLLMDKFDPDQVLRTIAEERTTILFGVPTMLDMMARSPLFANTDLSSLRFAVVGGEPMPIELIKIWQARGIAIRQGYGLTEFGPNVFSLNAEDSERKLGSIGFPNFYVDAAIVAEDGSQLEEDKIGELVLRGPTVMPGYWQHEQATAEAIRDGWLHTGDLVRRDAEGYYYVVGRKKDMYISGGENVYPAEIEQVLRANPLILEAAVIGVPNEKWGEVGRAYIVKEPTCDLTSEAVMMHCQKALAKYKIPKEIRFVKDLPKGDSGKILKRVLRELEAESH